MPRKKAAAGTTKTTVTPKEKVVTVKVIKKYFDTIQNKQIEPNTEFVCSQDRAQALTKAKVAEVLSIK